MYLIPSVKEAKEGEKRELKGCTIVFPEGVDPRLINVAKKLPNGEVKVVFSIGSSDSEEYKIIFGDTINVEAKGTKGAFYAIQTLRQIVKNVIRNKLKIHQTNSYVELTVTYLKEHKIMFAIMKDITSDVNYADKLNDVKLETFKTTDEVIKKQMRVAQEIASLLGETTAETKIALTKLKETLKDE